MRHLFSRLIRRAGSKATTQALNCERLEARDVPATTLMYPGSDLQTNLGNPFSSANDIQLGSHLTATRDALGNPIDFNKDGNNDAFVIASELIDDPNNNVYLNAGSRSVPLLVNSLNQFQYMSFSDESGNPPSTGGRYAAIVDINGDGRTDFYTMPSVAASGSNVTIFAEISNGDGTFSRDAALTQTLGTILSAGSNALLLSMGDLNGDGAPELIVPNLQAAGLGFYTTFNGTTGTGGKWDGKFDLANPNTIDTGLNTTTGNAALQNFNSPVVVDLNNDGKPEIVTSGAQGIRVFVNNGKGAFPTHLDLATSTSQTGLSMVSADFNNDGKPDLAVTLNNPESHPHLYGPVSVFINTSAGGSVSFTGANPYFSGGFNYTSIASADMNLDGNMDLVVSDITSAVFLIFEGDGKGAFVREDIYEAFDKEYFFPAGIGLGDWNKDGQVDVLTGTHAQSGLTPRPEYNPSLAIAINGTFVAPGISPTAMARGTVGQTYSQQLAFSGGDKSIPFQVSVDPALSPLPPGLTVSSSGLVTGTPTASGPFQVYFRVTQSNGLAGHTLAYLLVNPSSQGALTINPSTIADVSVNQVVNIPFSTTGGVTPYSYSVTTGLLPPGLNLSGTGYLTGVVSGTGTYTFGVTSTDFNGSTGYRQYTVVSTAAPLVPVLQPPTIVAGALSGNRVTVFDPSGNPRASFRPFAAAYTGGVNVAQGDVNGDGVPDLIAAVSGGAGPIVRVFNGRDLALITSFTAYTPSFTGGVRVAAGDVDGDGRAEVITGAGPGEVSRVKVFNGVTGKLQRAFFPFAQQYQGGVTVASGDVDGDGKADIIAGSGTAVRSTVKVFKGTTGALLSTIQPFAAGYTNGVTVGSGDINGDGHADIVVGTVGGTGGVVKVYSGANNALLHTLNPYGTGYKGGINLSVADLTGDGKAEIVTGTTQGNIRPVVKAFSGANYAQIDSFFAYSGAVGVSVAGK